MPLVDAFPTDAMEVAVDADETPAAYRSSASRPSGLFICGPSAGGHLAEPGMLRLARPLQQAGLGIVHFNFLYREQGRRRPDPMPELRRCFVAVVESALERVGKTGRLLLGGRSMGGRVASMLVADGFPCDGLLLLAYPLHPAGQPERLRAAHLPP
jgi:predicted alpha/beta-hydrolase family hydrolase